MRRHMKTLHCRSVGHEQTISKPSVVARMIELLHKPKTKLGKVLEIGTGCGYQAAVLSLLADEVYSIERIRPLHDMARAKLYAHFELIICASFMVTASWGCLKQRLLMALFWQPRAWASLMPYWTNWP